MDTAVVDAAVGAESRTERPVARRIDLTHEPALDGLRGVAVAAVLLFHLGRLQGGFLGVDLFFVLSGFLITSLLLTEHGGRGRIDLLRFWSRRARRLLPALFVMLTGVALLMAWLTPAGQRHGFRGDTLATVGYFANWRRASASMSYWDIFRQPSPLDHTWSLAIEEQFYMVWPLLVVALLGWMAGRRSPRVVGVAATLGALGSFAMLALHYEPGSTNRAYFGTDARLGATLLGAALAAFAVGRTRALVGRGVRQPLGLPALGGGAVMAWSLLAADGQSGWYYSGGLALFAAASVLVIATVTGRGCGGSLAQGLSWAPLRWLGTVSYGVYLWHWPMIVCLTPERARVDGLALDTVRVAATLALATASYLVVEQPIRRGALPGWRIAGLAAVAVGATASAVLVTTSGLPTSAGPRREFEQLGHLPDDLGPGTPKILLVGDSGAAGSVLGGELVLAGEMVDVRVGYLSDWCSVLSVEPVTLHTGTGEEQVRPWCPSPRLDTWRDAVADYDPDVVVYYLAWAGEVYKEKLDGEWVWDCDPAYDAFVREALGAEIDLLASRGATVVIATSPYSGHPESASRRRVDCRNDTYREVAAAHPGTEVVDLNAFVESAGEERPSWFADTVHLSSFGARQVARWLIPRLVP